MPVLNTALCLPTIDVSMVCVKGTKIYRIISAVSLGLFLASNEPKIASS